MKRILFATTIAIALLAGATWTAAVWRQTTEARRESTRLRQELTRLAQQREEYRQRAASLKVSAVGESTDSKAKAAAPAPLAAPSTTPASGVAAASSPRRSNSIVHLIRNEPESQLVYLAQRKAALAAEHGPLFRQLELAPDAREQFQANILRRDEIMMDLAVLAAEGGDVTAINELQQKARSDYYESQRALLGDEGYQAFRDYERSSSVRSMISAIAGMTVVEGVPLSPSQADLLVRAVANSCESYRRGGYFSHSGGVDWNAALMAARTILTPAQYEVFSTMDPGPTTGGLLQTRMYSRVNEAVEQDRAELKHAQKPK
jgi:hypothetical protein